MNVITLTIRLVHFIRVAFDRLMNNKRTAPAIGRNISVLSIGYPRLVVICSMFFHRRRIHAPIIRAPVAIIAA